MVLKLPKRVYFLQICDNFSKNINVLKQFTTIRLKDLIKLYQKIVFL